MAFGRRSFVRAFLFGTAGAALTLSSITLEAMTLDARAPSTTGS